MHEIVFTSSYQSPRAATLIESALEPEIGDIDGDRTTVDLTRSGSDLELRVEAADPVALRAGQNTWLGLLEVAERVEASVGRVDGTTGG